MTDERECLQCGETPATIKRNELICGIEGGYEYRELEYEWPRHRWADWTDKELARAGIKAEAFEKHRRTPAMTLQWVGCDDRTRGHMPADAEDVGGMWASRVGECLHCGKQVSTETNEGAIDGT